MYSCWMLCLRGSNRTGIVIGNAWRLLVLKVRRELFWTDFWFKMLLTFKASMPLLANLTFRNGRFLVSVGSSTLTALNSLFEEISKIIPWSRCPGDPTSAKCKVKVDWTYIFVRLCLSTRARVKFCWWIRIDIIQIKHFSPLIYFNLQDVYLNRLQYFA